MATDHRLLPVRTLEFQTERTDSAVSTMADVGQNRKQNNANPSRSDALMVGGSTSSSSSTTLSLPDSRAVLDAMSHVLRSAESELQQLERDNILGTAVIRACGEVADLVAHLALQLEDQTDLERRHFAAACLQDFQSSSSQDSLRLMRVEEGSLDDLSRPIENATTSTALVVDSGSNSISNGNNFMTEDDVVGIMGKVATLLRDVEFSLRSIDANDAADLADTALIVAQLALTALQNVHQQLVSHVLQQSNAEEAEWNASSGRTMHRGTGSGRSDFSSPEWQGSPNIVLLEEDEDRDDDEASSRSPHDTNAATTEPGTKSPSPSPPSSYRHLSSPPQRTRCLWPPLAPHALNAVEWSRLELSKHHWLVTATIGVTFWPVWATTAIVASSAVVADNVVQALYRQFQDSAVIASAEYAATSIYQSTKLSYLSAKAVAKPTWRVAQRQLQRHGPAVQAWAVHKVQHPVQTLRETAQGAAWCLHQVGSVVSHKWHEWQQYHESDRHQCAQDLQL